MNTRYETDNDLQELRDARGQDREISLGTATILGIFFALALLCAAFFGFGYSLGRRSAQPVANVTEPTTTGAESSSAKPAPGSPASQPLPSSTAKQAMDAGQSRSDSDETSSAPAEEPQPVATPLPSRPVVSNSRSEARTEPAIKVVPKVIGQAAAGPAAPIVQVAAVSHQEDADVLFTALKRKGYNVVIRHEPQDKLLHVQIGPFASKKEADAMRQRLQTDGYNAIVK